MVFLFIKMKPRYHIYNNSQILFDNSHTPCLTTKVRFCSSSIKSFSKIHLALTSVHVQTLLLKKKKKKNWKIKVMVCMTALKKVTIPKKFPS